jgi:hypothetical protein
MVGWDWDPWYLDHKWAPSTRSEWRMRHMEHLEERKLAGEKKYSERSCLRATSLLGAWFPLRPWRWRRFVYPKRRLTFSRSQAFISQNVQIFNVVFISFLPFWYFPLSSSSFISISLFYISLSIFLLLTLHRHLISLPSFPQWIFIIFFSCFSFDSVPLFIPISCSFAIISFPSYSAPPCIYPPFRFPPFFRRQHHLLNYFRPEALAGSFLLLFVIIPLFLHVSFLPPPSPFSSV